MGTRNLTIVKADGEYKIAQYGQWDGYPSGQGATALKFLRSKTNREKLRKALKYCKFVTDEQIEKYAKDMGLGDWMTMEEAERWNRAHPFFSRDHGAAILSMIANTAKAKNPVELRNSISFASDSLFCEWAYIIDFDKGTFEVYRGFNTKPVPKSERFASMPKNTESGSGKYYPVRLVKSFKLGRLPKEEYFLKVVQPKEEE
jgi:hypothetical protein